MAAFGDGELQAGAGCRRVADSRAYRHPLREHLSSGGAALGLSQPLRYIVYSLGDKLQWRRFLQWGRAAPGGASDGNAEALQAFTPFPSSLPLLLSLAAAPEGAAGEAAIAELPMVALDGYAIFLRRKVFAVKPDAKLGCLQKCVKACCNCCACLKKMLSTDW